MKFTAAFVALISATGAVAAPAADSVSMMAATAQWTIQSLNRVCDKADTTCTWNFKINTGSGAATPCKYVVKAKGASKANGGPVKCGTFTITSGWSGQFGPSKGFTTVSVVNNKKQIIYASYTDKQLASGKVVKPDQKVYKDHIYNAPVEDARPPTSTATQVNEALLVHDLMTPTVRQDALSDAGSGRKKAQTRPNKTANILSDQTLEAKLLCSRFSLSTDSLSHHGLSSAIMDPPDSITVAEFMSSEKYHRYPITKARNPYTCGLTGKTHTAAEVIAREDYLARGIEQALQLDPHPTTSEWDRVLAVFSFNTIDYIPLTHSIHRLNGIASLSSAALSASELEQQLRVSHAKAIFTCVPLLETAIKASGAAGIPRSNVFVLPMPGTTAVTGFRTVEDLVEDGKKLPGLLPLRWTLGQGARQAAYLLYSSGTSGLPKPVMISHHNIIAGIIQTRTFDSVSRKADGIETQIMLGLLPFSHVFGLMLITHLGAYRGDEIIVMPRFEFESFLGAVSRFKIEQLPIVPPIVIQMLDKRDICQKYDLSSVRFVYTGAAPLGRETVDDLLGLYPKWRLGMTETSTVFIQSSEHDTQVGTTGSLLPAVKAKIVDTDGSEITNYEKPGELLIQSPTVSLGYFNNPKATAETFFEDGAGRWIRTGDEVLVRMSDTGNEHFVVVDRVKELIKVKGNQVAPAELEAHLLTHPAVSDCAVIQVPDARAGEVPKAFIVKSDSAIKSEEELARDIQRYVEEHKARYKWLKGGVEFVEAIPKSPTGKILRRKLRDRERERRKTKGSKL
ncbi:hypothetical protein F66182_5268 [Fusarium sp. NRRL 66182]|nr:hypothetical protein F66182_5268 [Fusarium sp. NRRL 66182]